MTELSGHNQVGWKGSSYEQSGSLEESSCYYQVGGENHHTTVMKGSIESSLWILFGCRVAVCV
jgi:hypothetical protein